ncbi:MAG: hypothetical protein Q4C33_03705 [bacterium]|nr:hypothetical protein [bacterium]
MEGLTAALPVIIYLLLIILLVIGIILGIKLIITIDKTNAILDDVSKKVATLDTIFNIVDGVSNKMAYLGGKMTQGVVTLINKVTGLKRRKDEDDFYE